MKLLRNGIGVFPIRAWRYVKRVFSLHHTSKNRYKNRVLSQKVPSGPYRKGFGSNIDLKMKISAVLLLFGAFVLQANPSYAQKKISLNLENVTVERLLDEIESRTDFRFIYSTEDVDIDRRVSVVVKREAVSTILNDVFVGTRTSFSVEDGQIFLLPNKNPITKPATVVNQDPITVTGQVTNADGVPLPGVSVIIKGTSRGTATDFDGNYQIVVPSSQSILVFTSIGYTEQEITVGDQTTINVTLDESVSQLDEVVLNAGYYKTEKKIKTGNIAQVSAVEIERQPINNPLQALQGRVSGVFIEQNTGVAGGGFDILIRGQNSLRNDPQNNGNRPLYIINGVPFTSEPLTTSGGLIIGSGNPLSSINPQDIESIEILKDADATAIYGSRGANGVVLITTKQGKQGKPSFEINHWSGLGHVGNKMDLLNSAQYLEMRREAFRNDGVEPRASDFDVNGTWDVNRETDWQDELIGGTAVTSNTQATFSGGNDLVQYLFSNGYYRETTVFPGDNSYNRYSTNLNLNFTSKNKKFNANISSSYSVENNNLPPLDLTRPALLTPPVAPTLFDEDGNLNWEEGTFDNPLADTKRFFESRTTNVIGNALLSYEIFRGFQIRTSFGYTELRTEQNTISPIAALDPFNPNAITGSNQFNNQSIRSWIVEPQLDWAKALGRAKLNVLVGTTFQQNENTGEFILASGYTSDALIRNIVAAPELDALSISDTDYRYSAVFGRINFNYDGRYILNLTGRRDGSSRFGPGNRFSNFGAVGAAWILSEESFASNLPWLSFAKIRSSYGVTGSDQIPDYGYFELWNPGSALFEGQTPIAPASLSNPEYSWEENKKFEVALELGLFKNRVQFNGSYFRNLSGNQLIGLPLPRTTGFFSVTANFPAEVENKGLELELNTINISSSSFTWSTGFNITIPRNELLSFSNIEQSNFSNIYSVGEPLGIQNQYKTLGVNPETGFYSFEDVDADGNISFGIDRQFLESQQPEYFGGLTNNISYKGLELDFLFQFVKQTGLSYLNGLLPSPGGFSNQPSVVLNRWQEPGDITDIQRFTQTGSGVLAYNNLLQSTAANADRSFVRLKNVSLSYMLPVELVEKIGLQQLRLYLQGQNLLTFTDFIGLDPETQQFALPPLRTITLGAQLTF